jgi:predicted polyphosphate/ATP-dependent NAD kinase
MPQVRRFGAEDTHMRAGPPCIGIIANPVSARDIRRIIASASNLQIADRVNIVLRVLAAAGSCGVESVLMMPDKGGIRALLARSLERERSLHHRFPEVRFLDMEVTSTVEDTFRAARMLRDAGVTAIVVLGGDGTHRAVVRECGQVPVAGLSTGTNNAFPDLQEPTIVGMAVGLYASGRLPREQALASNKMLEIAINGDGRRDVALVDAVLCAETCIGARALWRTDTLRALYVTYASPEAIGMSAIAGLLQPVGRRDPGGCTVELSEDPARRRLILQAPIAPGLVRPVGVASWQTMPRDRPFRVADGAGVLALDGEREIELDPGDEVTITLREEAFLTVDVPRCMRAAVSGGLLHTIDPPLVTAEEA